MNGIFDQRRKERNKALDRLGQAAQQFADANDRASRAYGVTLNEQASLSVLRVRLREFDEAQAKLRGKVAA